jgi:hypothetical protein
MCAKVVFIRERILRFFSKIELHRIEPDNNQIRLAFLARNPVPLLDIRIHVNFFVTFRTNRRRHFLISPEIY